MTVRGVRRLVGAVCVIGVAGMIVFSILDRNGTALASGLVTAVAILCLMVATSVERGGGATDLERQGERVEELVRALAADGADERRLRMLVRESVSLGRGGAARIGQRAQAKPQDADSS